MRKSWRCGRFRVEDVKLAFFGVERLCTKTRLCTNTRLPKPVCTKTRYNEGMRRRTKIMFWIALAIYDVLIVAILGLMIWASQSSMEEFPLGRLGR